MYLSHELSRELLLESSRSGAEEIRQPPVLSGCWPRARPGVERGGCGDSRTDLSLSDEPAFGEIGESTAAPAATTVNLREAK